MSTAQYVLVLIVALVAGGIGRIGAGRLAERGLLPTVFLPANVQIRKGFFEIVDNGGDRRVRLEKQRFLFFDDHREPYEMLNPSMLTLYDEYSHRSVEVGFGAYLVRAAQSVAHHQGIRIPDLPLHSQPQLGVYLKDGQVIWAVPDPPVVPPQPKNHNPLSFPQE